MPLDVVEAQRPILKIDHIHACFMNRLSALHNKISTAFQR